MYTYTYILTYKVYTHAYVLCMRVRGVYEYIYIGLVYIYGEFFSRDPCQPSPVHVTIEKYNLLSSHTHTGIRVHTHFRGLGETLVRGSYVYRRAPRGQGSTTHCNNKNDRSRGIIKIKGLI